jgi:NCAIR mutase (PurE)-related protein
MSATDRLAEQTFGSVGPQLEELEQDTAAKIRIRRKSRIESSDLNVVVVQSHGRSTLFVVSHAAHFTSISGDPERPLL